MLCVAAGCTRVAVMPTARSLMAGQDESSYMLQASKFTVTTKSATAGIPASSTSEWNVVFGGDKRFGLPWRGAEAGVSLDTGVNLMGDVKYQLWIPADQRTPIAAVDAEGGVNLLGPSAGAAFIATKPVDFGDLTGALRITHQRFGFLKTSDFSSSNAKYGVSAGRDAATYIDLGVALHFDRPWNGIVLAANLRLPIVQGTPTPGTDVMDYGPALTFAASWQTKNFVPFSGSGYAAPRSHVMAYSPYGAYTAKEHMALAKRLYHAGMYLDARDEFNAALLEDAATTEAYKWIGQCFDELKEWDLAYANYVAALRYHPHDDDLKALAKAALAKSRSGTRRRD